MRGGVWVGFEKLLRYGSKHSLLRDTVRFAEKPVKNCDDFVTLKNYCSDSIIPTFPRFDKMYVGYKCPRSN